MADNKLFRPKSYSLRSPTDKKRHHGAIVNPPRTAEIGGLDQVKEPHGLFKNDMSLRKPGGTRSSTK